MKYGIRVLIKKTNEYGYIIRRIDSQRYEIWLDSEKEISISPEEFVEIKKEKNE